MAQNQFWAAQNWVWAASCRRKMSVALRKKTRLTEHVAGVRVATPQMGSKIGPKHLVFCSFTGKHGGARPPPNKQETRKPRTKLPQESRKTCKNMVFLYTDGEVPNQLGGQPVQEPLDGQRLQRFGVHILGDPGGCRGRHFGCRTSTRTSRRARNDRYRVLRSSAGP